MDLSAHHDVLSGCQAFMQVVRLKDEAQLPPHQDQLRLVSVFQLLID